MMVGAASSDCGCKQRREYIMRVFGYSIPVILLIAIAFIVGAKNPSLISRVPIIGNN